MLSKKPMQAGEKYLVQLSHGAGGSDFDFLGGTEGQPAWVDMFVLSQQENGPVVFSMHSFRTG